MPHTPPETIEERIGAFAQINDFYQRGVPMGKLVAFIKEEITRAKEEGRREKAEEILPILKEASNYLHLGNEPVIQNLMYIPPAQAMRNAADELERKESVIYKFRQLIVSLSHYQPKEE